MMMIIDDIERDEVGDERIGNGNGETADIAIASPNPFTLFGFVPTRTSFLALSFISSLGDVRFLPLHVCE